MYKALLGMTVVCFFATSLSCTMRHTIEPSDKPLIVNLNVKIDHEIKVKIKEENADLLNLEQEVMKKKKG